MTEIFLLIISAVFVNNFVLARFLGICPYLGVSKRVETAVGMGAAVVFVMTLASVVSWSVHYYLLVKFGLEYLQIIAFILIIAALVQLVEMFVQKMSQSLYKALGIYLPLITTNCAVLGVSILNIQKKFTLLYTLFYGFAASLGFGLAIVIFAGIRERIELMDVPKPLKGISIGLITAGILSLAFLGFSGLVKE
ncbi:MAG: electron transport complex subunit RsxA [Candidatus Coatesbacteria bacterium]|nr:electron transport complex subunit RsxA [Candidatus Coatesbacteria bacterium]